jgi:hypothetical protein
MKTIAIDKLDYLMLEQLARKAHKRPNELLKDLIRIQYDKIR